jgi:hypothetical protein
MLEQSNRAILQDANLCLVLRATYYLSPKASRDSILHLTHLRAEEIEEKIQILIASGLIDCSKDSFAVCTNTAPTLIEAVSAVAATQLVRQRAANFRVDISGRLQWIDDMAEMIEHARRSHREAI